MFSKPEVISTPSNPASPIPLWHISDSFSRNPDSSFPSWHHVKLIERLSYWGKKSETKTHRRSDIRLIFDQLSIAISLFVIRETAMLSTSIWQKEAYLRNSLKHVDVTCKWMGGLKVCFDPGQILTTKNIGWKKNYIFKQDNYFQTIQWNIHCQANIVKVSFHFKNKEPVFVYLFQNSNGGIGWFLFRKFWFLKFCMFPSCVVLHTDFRTVFVFDLGPFLPM